MKLNKTLIFIILVLMLISGYIVVPFNKGNFLDQYSDITMKYGNGTTTLKIIMWIFGMRFLLLLDGILMVMLIYMKRTKLSMLIIVGLIILTRVADIIQLFIDGDTSGNLYIEMSINAIFLFFALSAVNIINITGLNKEIANSETSVITLSIPFSKHISNLFRPKQKLESTKLVEELVDKDSKLRYIADRKEKLESPLMAKITNLVKMIEKSETQMEKEVLMHEFELTLARYAKNSEEISDILKGKKKLSG